MEYMWPPSSSKRCKVVGTVTADGLKALIPNRLHWCMTVDALFGELLRMKALRLLL